MNVPVEVTITPDLDKLTKALRKIGDGKLIKNELAKALRQAADEAVRIEREEIMGTRIEGVKKSSRGSRGGSRPAGGKGIRKPIANAIKRQSRLTTSKQNEAGIEIRVSRTKLPDGLKNIPSQINRKGSWRHPVFGNRRVWAEQKATPEGWWQRGIDKAIPVVRPRMMEAMSVAERRMRDTLGNL